MEGVAMLRRRRRLAGRGPRDRLGLRALAATREMTRRAAFAAAIARTTGTMAVDMGDGRGLGDEGGEGEGWTLLENLIFSGGEESWLKLTNERALIDVPLR